MAILEQLQEQIEDLKQELEIQKADKQELQRLKDVQEIQNVMCQYEYLHYPILFPEKLNVFALDMPDVSMDVGDSGVFVGREGIETVFLKILGSARFAKGAFFMHCITTPIIEVAKDGKMKAVVSITLDDEFVVHDIKVIEGEKGLFIAMPSRKASDGEYRDIAHPINSETRERIQTIILEQYEKAAAESAEAEEAAE